MTSLSRIALLMVAVMFAGNAEAAQSCRITVQYRLQDGTIVSRTNCVPNGGPNCNANYGTGYCDMHNAGNGIVSKSCQPVSHC